MYIGRDVVGPVHAPEGRARQDEGSELIDTQALTHLACLWYAVNDEADEENRALPVLSSDEPVISTSR